MDSVKVVRRKESRTYRSRDISDPHLHSLMCSTVHEVFQGEKYAGDFRKEFQFKV